MFILKLIQTFAVTFQKTIEGKFDHSYYLNKSKIFAKFKIFSVFQELYHDFTEVDYNPLLQFTDLDIFLLIKQFQAQQISGFLPMDAFNALLKPELEKLIVPANNAVDQVANILVEYSNTILNTQLIKQQFIYESLAQLKETFQTQINAIIIECQIQTKSVINDALRAEIEYLFSNDFQLYDKGNKLFILFASNKDEIQQRKFMTEFRNYFLHYIQLVVRAVRDNIPKLIGFFLIKKCQIKMFENLQLNLWQNEEILSMIKEEPKITAERESVINQISILKGIKRIILNNNPSFYKQVEVSGELQENSLECSSNQMQEPINQRFETKAEEAEEKIIDNEENKIKQSGAELQITSEEKLANFQVQIFPINKNELITPSQKTLKKAHSKQQIFSIKKCKNRVSKVELQDDSSECSSKQTQQPINLIFENQCETQAEEKFTKNEEKNNKQSVVEVQLTSEQKIANLQEQTFLIKQNELITPSQKIFKMVHLEQQILSIQKYQNRISKPERIQQMKKQIDEKNLEVLFQVIGKILKVDQGRELIITPQQLDTGLNSLFCPDLNDYKCYKYRSQKQQRRYIDINDTLIEFENHILKLKIQLADLEILEVIPEIGEVYFNFKNNKEYLLKEVCQGQIEVYNYFINPLNNIVGLSPLDFDPKYNMYWSLKHKEKEKRGPKGRTYDYFFPRGYSGYGLKVLEKYGNDTNWIKMDGNEGEWRILYHGTKRQYLQKIVQEGLKAGKGQKYRNQTCLITNEKVGQGTYLTDNIKMAEHFTDKIIQGLQEFHLVFQTRVNPKAIRQSQRMKEKSYFLVNNQKDIRPYRILLRKVNLEQEKNPDNKCISF